MPEVETVLPASYCTYGFSFSLRSGPDSKGSMICRLESVRVQYISSWIPPLHVEMAVTSGAYAVNHDYRQTAT